MDSGHTQRPRARDSTFERLLIGDWVENTSVDIGVYIDPLVLPKLILQQVSELLIPCSSDLSMFSRPIVHALNAPITLTYDVQTICRGPDFDSLSVQGHVHFE